MGKKESRVFLSTLWLGVFAIFPGTALPARCVEYHAPAKKEGKLPEQVRIGLFNLFHPRAVGVKPVTAALKVDCDGAPLAILQPGRPYRVVVEGERVRLLADGGSSAASIAEGERLQLSASPGNDPPNEIELDVSGRRGHLVRRVRGQLAFSARDTELQTVLVQNTEDAVAVITASEMTGIGLPEALKCQAVVVRSFLLTHLGRHQAAGYDLCDNTHCQLYFGEAQLLPNSTRLFQAAASAARATRGETLWNGEQPLEAYFTACCGGHTTTPDIAWGVGAALAPPPRAQQAAPVPSSKSETQNSKLKTQNSTVACSWCQGAHFYRWQRAVGRSALLDALSSVWDSRPSESVSLRIAGRSPMGFVTALTLTDGHRTVTLSNAQLRGLVGHHLGWNTILSNVYSLELHGERYIIRGHGFGHQVGLCVEGTIAQARAGRAYREILRFYFPQATVEYSGG